NCYFFFFKQKTAYEISRDWSSDVCSSDLEHRLDRHRVHQVGSQAPQQPKDVEEAAELGERLGAAPRHAERVESDVRRRHLGRARSEERRVGKEGRCRWRAEDEKKKMQTDD